MAVFEKVSRILALIDVTELASGRDAAEAESKFSAGRALVFDKTIVRTVAVLNEDTREFKAPHACN